MVLPISIDDVRKAIESRRVPQCYEQILRTLETRLSPNGGTLSPQTLSRHVRTLLAVGDVVELVDHATVASLGAFPQHFRRSTKFFLGVDVARERLGAAAVRDLLASQRGNSPRTHGDGAPRTDTTQDASAAPALFELSTAGTNRAQAPTPPAAVRQTARTRPDTRALHTVETPRGHDRAPDDRTEAPAASTPRADRGTTTASAGTPRTGTPTRHPARITTPKVIYDVTGSGAVMSSLQPQFSSGPPAPVTSGEQTLEEITARLAQILDETARALGDYADNTVLPLNRAWHEGDFGADAARAADRLSHLYTLAQTYRDDLAAVAATLGYAEPAPELRNGTRG